MHRYYIITVSLIIFLSTACKNKTIDIAETENENITITKAQFNNEGMVLGKPEKHAFNQTIQFNGKLAAQNNALAVLSIPVEGIVKAIKIKPGEYVKHGMPLLEISGFAFSDLQKDFMASAALLKKHKKEYQRAKTLYNENIGTESTYLNAEADYNTNLAEYKALKLKLKSINIPVDEIEKGNFRSSYYLTAPIAGNIAMVNLHLGQFVEANQSLIEIINLQKLQLKIAVYQKDIPTLTQGQSVVFSTINNNKEVYQAQLSTIGRQVDAQTNTVGCIASINQQTGVNFIANQFVEGHIITKTDSAFAVPETALINAGDDTFVLKLINTGENYEFEQVKINITRRSNGWVEITNKLIPENILLKGGENLLLE